MTTILALIGLGLGAITGLRALLQPHWIANVLKLQADPTRPGGFAEFRASFGGLVPSYAPFWHLRRLVAWPFSRRVGGCCDLYGLVWRCDRKGGVDYPGQS